MKKKIIIITMFLISCGSGINTGDGTYTGIRAKLQLADLFIRDRILGDCGEGT